MRKPRLLDLFSGAGGAARGYQLAGFEVVGVDIRPQPRYVGEHFCQADIMEVGLPALLRELGPFDAVHASPPCQAYSEMSWARPGNSYPNLIPRVREGLRASGLPYVIENVKRAPLLEPTQLCGTMFALELIRHRWFEATFPLPFLLCAHAKPGGRAGHWRTGQYVSVAGNCAPIALAREAMGIDWMTRDELAQAIPPAYTKWIGAALLSHLTPTTGLPSRAQGGER